MVGIASAWAASTIASVFVFKLDVNLLRHYPALLLHPTFSLAVVAYRGLRFLLGLMPFAIGCMATLWAEHWNQ